MFGRFGDTFFHLLELIVEFMLHHLVKGLAHRWYYFLHRLLSLCNIYVIRDIGAQSFGYEIQQVNYLSLPTNFNHIVHRVIFEPFFIHLSQHLRRTIIIVNIYRWHIQHTHQIHLILFQLLLLLNTNPPYILLPFTQLTTIPHQPFNSPTKL